DFKPGAQDGLIPVTSTAKAEHEIANGDNEDYDDAAYEGVELEPLQQVLGSAPHSGNRDASIADKAVWAGQNVKYQVQADFTESLGEVEEVLSVGVDDVVPESL